MSISDSNKSGSGKKYILYFCLLNLAAFLVYHFAFYIFKHQATLYVYFYFNELLNALFPVLAATLVFKAYSATGVKKAFSYAILFALCRISYAFPYYAYEYAYQLLEIGSVIMFAALYTLFSVAIVFLQILLLFLLMLFVDKKLSERGGAVFQRSHILNKSLPLDFSNPTTRAIFAASLAMFVYNLVCEIIDTATYLSDVYGLYDLSEIAYIVFRYFFILALLFISHFVTVYVKNNSHFL